MPRYVASARRSTMCGTAVHGDLVTARREAAADLLHGGLEAAVGGRDAARADEGDLHGRAPAAAMAWRRCGGRGGVTAAAAAAAS